MYRFKCFLSLLLLSSSLLSATLLENAESKKTTKWSVVPSKTMGKINNIYNKDKKSRVIQLIGEHTQSVYKLSLKHKNTQATQYHLSWEMNYNEDFVIMIELNTTKGKYTLIYTPGNEDSYLQYGLGETAALGNWKKFERNLLNDLQNAIADVQILELKNFVIKGSGLLDNIQMVDPQRATKKVIKKSIAAKNIEKPKAILKESSTVKTKSNNKKTSHMPVIYLNGKNPVLLKKGERYVEAGATAVDKRGTNLNVDISHQIDILKEGEYSVIYMTTNHLGNSVIETRRVIVGEISEQKENTISSEDALNLDRRSQELSTWEEELKAREEALSKKKIIEQRSTNKAPENYPSRPGL